MSAKVAVKLVNNVTYMTSKYTKPSNDVLKVMSLITNQIHNSTGFNDWTDFKNAFHGIKYLNLGSLTHSLTHSLAYSLAYSLTHSLTHLLTYLLTHLLTGLLTHSLIHVLLLTHSNSLTHSLSS